MNVKRSTTALVFFALATSPYVAIADEQSVVAALSDCAEIQNATERLRCFDSIASRTQLQMSAKEKRGEVRDVEAALAKPTASVDETLQAESTLQRQRIDPNEFAPLASRNGSSDSIRATITSLGKSRLDRWRISLENGQVWMQTDNRRINLAVGQDVILQKGSFSSFFLKLPDLNARLKVTRIQ